MARFSNIQYYKIEDTVENNLMNCELKFEDSTCPMEASALKYQNFEDAEKLYTILCEINSPWLTKPHGIRKVENQAGGFVFVEKITPFSDWLKKNKSLRWKIYGDNNTCIGIGDDFKKKFKQILSGLEAIHNSNNRHGCLSEGVYVGKDDNIRLSNFVFFDVTINTLKEDLKEYQKLVHEAIYPTGDPSVQIREVKEFNDLFTHYLRNFCEEDAFWLYKTPFLWDSHQKIHFFDKLNDAFKINPQMAKVFFKPKICVGGWQSKIHPNGPLDATYTYPVYNKKTGKNDTNHWYNNENQCGVVVLIRNFNHHKYPFVDPFNEIELVFPGITSIIYFELLNGSYKSRTLNPRYPVNYQVQQLVDHTVSGVSEQSRLKLTMSAMDYIKDKMKSIW